MADGTWDRIQRDTRVTAIFAAVSTFVGLLLVRFQDVGSPWVAMLWSLACFAGGGLLGFLFGIPRVLQGSTTPSGDGAPGYRIQVNTNLEQISDWLTKIIVGVGLIQLTRAPELVSRVTTFAAGGLGAPGSASARLLALGIIGYFSLVGFLCGYLLTRIYLAQAFSRADWGAQNTVTIAGEEVSVDKAAEQQRRLIADVQAQVIQLQEQLSASAGAAQGGVSPRAVPAEAADTPRSAAINSVLWVDDNPSNNLAIVEQLRNRGIQVVTVLSTDEALQQLRSHKFDRVISDMGRRERWIPVQDAGVRLLQAMRKEGMDVPTLIYCSAKAVEKFGDEARAAGAKIVTASPTKLLRALAVDQAAIA